MTLRTLLLILACLLVLPGSAWATGFLVKLKKGGTFVASNYWEQGNTLYFNALGGTIGIPREQVLTILDTEIPEETANSTANTGAGDEAAGPLVNAGEETGQEAGDGAAAKEPAKEESEAPLTILMKQKGRLVGTLRFHYQKLKEEEDIGNKTRIKRRKLAIKDLLEQLSQLTRQAATLNNGHVPEWWEDIPIPDPPE